MAKMLPHSMFDPGHLEVRHAPDDPDDGHVVACNETDQDIMVGTREE
jgi:hypothetical protein